MKSKNILLVIFILLSFTLKAQTTFFKSQDFFETFIRFNSVPMPQIYYASTLLINESLGIKQVEIDSIATVSKLRNKRLEVCFDEEELYDFVSNPLKYTTKSNKNSCIIYSNNNKYVIEYENNKVKKIVDTPFFALFFIYDDNENSDDLQRVIILHDTMFLKINDNSLINDYTWKIKHQFVNKKLKKREILFHFTYKLVEKFDTLTGALQTVNYYEKHLYSLRKSLYIFGENNIDTIIRNTFYFPLVVSKEIKLWSNRNIDSILQTTLVKVRQSDTLLLKFNDNLPSCFLSINQDTLYKFVYFENKQKRLIKYIYHYQENKAFKIDTFEYTDNLLYKKIPYEYVDCKNITFHYKYKNYFCSKKIIEKDDYIYYFLKIFIFEKFFF